uniref:Uncharacterized protein n=1 Tax=Oryza sativa subsp. japonica TaxID=39947 RepID=Q6YWH7_ORYSJ|nr:hypothetical protein [Oryza sativa Japonica Group]
MRTPTELPTTRIRTAEPCAKRRQDPHRRWRTGSTAAELPGPCRSLSCSPLLDPSSVGHSWSCSLPIERRGEEVEMEDPPPLSSQPLDPFGVSHSRPPLTERRGGGGGAKVERKWRR